MFRVVTNILTHARSYFQSLVQDGPSWHWPSLPGRWFIVLEPRYPAFISLRHLLLPKMVNSMDLKKQHGGHAMSAAFIYLCCAHLVQCHSTEQVFTMHALLTSTASEQGQHPPQFYNVCELSKIPSSLTKDTHR
jgi:hypothetical protein